MVKGMVLVSAVAASALGFGQSLFEVDFDNMWGGAQADSFRSIVTEPSGVAYVSALATANTAGRKAWDVVKVDLLGNVVWTREINIPNQLTVTPFQYLSIGPSNQLIATAVLQNFATNDVPMARLSNAAGTVLWQKSFGLEIAVRPVVTATRVFGIVRGIPTFPDRTILFCRNAGNGSLLWTRDLGLTVNVGHIRLRADAGGEPIVVTQRLSECQIRKFDQVTGSTTWTRTYAELTESEFEFDILKPSGTLLVGVATDVNPRFEFLDPSTGGTIRTEALAAGSISVSGVAAGRADSYFRFEQGVSGTYELRDRTGLPIVQGLFEDPNAPGQIDPMGHFHLNGGRFYEGTNQYEFRAARIAAEAIEFFPVLDEEDPPAPILSAITQTDLALAGNKIYIVGECDVDPNPFVVNMQGRLLRATQKLDARLDRFSVLMRPVPAMLDVPAPGVLANDAGWFSTGPILVNPTTNGTVTLNTDGSFTYLPNPGFFGSDSFVYKLRLGTVEKFAVCEVGVIALSAVTVPQPEVVGGNNLQGTVVLSGENRNVPIIVQLSDNSPAVLVTSSIAIPFGKIDGKFNIITSPVTADEICTITGKLQGITKTVQLTIKRATPASLVLDPNNLVGGQPFVGTVTMTGKAPPAGYVVNLTHSGTEIGMPISLTIPAGQSVGTFNGTTQPRSIPVTHFLTASSGGVSRSASLRINPGGLYSLSITPSTMQGGLNATGKVQVAGLAPAGGTLVALSVNGGKVQVPPSVTVPAGQQFVTFVITTQAVVTTGTRTVTATFGNITRTANLTLVP